MFELADFYDYASKSDIDIIPFAGAPSAGTTMRDGSFYAIFLDFTKIHSTRLLKGVCVHELGHAATGALHKVDSPFELIERSEYRAKRWAAEHFLTREEFQTAFSLGFSEPWQLAEYFDLPQGDVMEALTYWTDRRGVTFTAN